MLMENVTPEHKVPKFFFILVLLLLSIFLAAKTWLTIREAKEVGEPVPYEYSISVEGLGEATAVPDIAKITYSIETKGATTQESQEKNATVGNVIIARLATEGTEKKDVKTTYFNTYQDYSYDEFGNSVLNEEWITTQSVEVTIRDIEKASSTLTLLGGLGATGIYGPTFEVENNEDAKDEARLLAIKDVKEKAQLIATEFGLKLKEVSSYSEWTDTPYYAYGGYGGSYESTTMEKSPSVEPGEEKIKLHVTATYTFKSSNK